MDGILSENELDEEHLVINCIVAASGKPTIATYALADSGCSAYAFIDSAFVQQHKLTSTLLKRPRVVEAFEGTPSTITHLVRLNMTISGHIEADMPLLVTPLNHYPIILGIPWFRRHNPQVLWSDYALTFNSLFCQDKCLSSAAASMREDPNPLYKVERYNSDTALSPLVTHCKATTASQSTRAERRAAACPKSLSKSTKSIVHSPSNAAPNPVQKVRPPGGTPGPRTLIPALKQPLVELPKPLAVFMIGAVPFTRLARKKDHLLFSTSLREIHELLSEKPRTDPRTRLPAQYLEFLDVFSRTEADKLPERRLYDHKIPLAEGKQPGYGPLYNMSQAELQELQKYLKKNLASGFIQASSSPAASPVLFVKKPSGDLRLCVDYRGLNDITVKNRYPLPLIRETLDALSKAVIYTKLDVIGAFNRLRMAAGEEWKTAFRTRYGLFEYNVMPFGLTNAPASFQHYINDVLREFLDVFCTAYMDDVLIFSNSVTEHEQHIKKVLAALQKAGLQIDIDKCEFHVTETLYLGLIITTKGIRMDPRKLAAVAEWPVPRNLKDVQAFIGFANFYRRFVKAFSNVVAAMIALTKKGIPFIWSEECQRSFDELKSRFVTAPVLQHFDPEKDIDIECDASDWMVGGVMSQKDDDGVLHPVAFFSKKHSPAECNYEIYDKELLAIVRCFEEWRPELEGTKNPINVLSDHKNLEYYMTTKQLSRRQARWSEFLSRFNFKITYRPGKLGGKPDAFTRRSGDLPSGEGDERLEYQKQVVLKPHNFHIPDPSQPATTKPIALASVIPSLNLESTSKSTLYHVLGVPKLSKLTLAPITIGEDNEEAPRAMALEDLISEAYENDNFTKSVLTALRAGAHKLKGINLSECKEVDDRVYWRELQLVVPDYQDLHLRILRSSHDAPVAGHLGRAKTYSIVARSYYWPSLRKAVARYVRNCHTCSRAKSSRFQYQGLLKPLPVPERRWKDISIDFVTGLPECEGLNAILLVIDRLTKMRHIIPCSNEVDARMLAQLFIRHIWKLHGLPNTIVSDRGPQFVAQFWESLCSRLKIQAKLSTAYHPETDGQTENANAFMEQFLRTYTSYQQDDWVEWLAMAEFAANNAPSESTGVSPFFANYGFDLRMGFEPVAPLPSNTSRARQLEAAEANRFADKMKDIQEFLRDSIQYAQALYEESANATRQVPPKYKVGDRVWLSAKNFRTQRPSRKLDWKFIGPCKILEVVGSHAYRLELPATMHKVHPVFHTNLLRLTSEDPVPGQVIAPPPPVVIDDANEYEVEEILDVRLHYRRWQYLVKWVGYADPTWEPTDSLKDARAVDVFHRLYPRAAVPTGINLNAAAATLRLSSVMIRPNYRQRPSRSSASRGELVTDSGKVEGKRGNQGSLGPAHVTWAKLDEA